MSESQSPAQAPPPPQPQPQHEQSQEPASPSPYSSDTVSATARPVSPFFRHRPLGRAPSPPTWACYEQIPARSELLGSSDESDSDSGDEAADEDSLSDADADADADPEDPDEEADDNSSLSDDAEAAGPMDVEDDDDSLGRALGGSDGGDPEKRDKGKQRAEAPQNPGSTGTGDAATTTTNGNGDGKSSPVIPHAAAVRHRRPRSRRPPVSALRPILTIQRSQGFVWNQDLFVPPYIKDRYVASTSPPTSTGVFSACASTSTSLGDYEIEVVEIRVRDGELDDIIP
ncbi:hypothetical protein EDB84DRAFT_1493834 [Lactarius hengduanensis]|nr:hypothetical protein EDB84DRAFT_1493834 [Lactarius hengduanensis]